MTELCVIVVIFVSSLMSTISLMVTMIRDKSSGIKEVLNANGQRRSVYIISMLAYQILLNCSSCMIYGYAVTQIYFLKNGEVSVMVVIGILLISNIANIAFSMCFSTFFDSSRLGAYAYFGFMLSVTVLYVSLVGIPLDDASDKHSSWIYTLNWVPIFPAMTLMLNYLPLNKKICLNQYDRVFGPKTTI